MSSAAVVLFNPQNEVLILQRHPDDSFMPGYWNLPGGKMDGGESPEETAIRECIEETDIMPHGLQYLTQYTVPKFGRMTIFISYTNTPSVHLDYGENTDYVWIWEEELDLFDFIPYHRDAIERAFNMWRL